MLKASSLTDSIHLSDNRYLIKISNQQLCRYSRMLRLIKRYKFSYRMLPEPTSERVPGRSIVMTSYPGALSSQDESYLIEGQDRELIVAGTPLIIDNHSLWSRLESKDHVSAINSIPHYLYRFV